MEEPAPGVKRVYKSPAVTPTSICSPDVNAPSIHALVHSIDFWAFAFP